MSVEHVAVAAAIVGTNLLTFILHWRAAGMAEWNCYISKIQLECEIDRLRSDSAKLRAEVAAMRKPPAQGPYR